MTAAVGGRAVVGAPARRGSRSSHGRPSHEAEELKLHLTLGDQEKIDLEIRRNWFTGTFTYSVDGKRHVLRDPLDPSTHFNVRFETIYRLTVGEKEEHKIVIVHTRPLFFAGFRPQEIEIFVNGELHETYKGY